MQLQRFLPFLAWWPLVNRETLLADLKAGLTGSLILVPQGVAFATIAGMPPEYGLYAAMVPVVVAALFGSSWHLVAGPTTAISIVVYATLSPLAEPGSPGFVQLALTLAFLTGVVKLALGWLRLGSLMNFVSHTVVIGFTAGAALLIAVSQFKNFFGLPVPRGASFAQTLHFTASQIGHVNLTAVAVASVLFQGLVVSFFSYLVWFWLLRRYLAANLAVFSFMTPLFGVTFGVLLLGEQLSLNFVIGAVLVLLGITFVSAEQWLRRRLRKALGQ